MRQRCGCGSRCREKGIERELSYDLHIHSCLSPCGDDDMTPGNIVGMAAIKGLDVIAVTDHNSCRNCPAVLKLAEQYGANVTDAARAGLLHDVTKALPPELQLQLCREYGIPLDPFSRDNPKTLHATTGAWVAKRIFGENEAVFQAIASHTTGCGHMNTLQKIIYIADYMEPNRDFPGVERLRAAVDRDLDLAVLLGLEMTVEMLRHQGRRVARDSLEAIESLRAGCAQ